MMELVDSILMSMRLSTVGNGLVIAGGAVGVATVAVIATGTEIVLTPAMIQLLIYKGLAAAAVGLIVVGSWLGRRGRQREKAGGGEDTANGALKPGMPPLHQSVNKAKEPAANTVRRTPSS
jgi:hypothetical protein